MLIRPFVPTESLLGSSRFAENLSRFLERDYLYNQVLFSQVVETNSVIFNLANSVENCLKISGPKIEYNEAR